MAYFGGKSRVAHEVWHRFGDVRNYVEPFCGSAAVLLARPTPPRIETVNDANCVAPETRILRADLTWVPAGDVKPGDRILGFDEFNPGEARPGFRAPSSYRKWRVTTVTATRVLQKPRYRLTFDDGTVVVSSADHLWLGGSHNNEAKSGRGWRWLKTESLVCNRETQRSWIMKLCDVTEKEESWEAGWLGGFFDGEGHLVRSTGWRLSAAQNPGPTLDRARAWLAARGFDTSEASPRKCVALSINGGMREAMRFLMLTRPERLIAKFQEKLPLASIYARKHQAVGLVSKEFLGVGDVVALETESHTFVAEGLASHNCFIANFWRAITTDADAVADLCDWPVNEADLHARHRWLMLSAGAAEWRERMKRDPDFYDVKVAAWWVWGACQWIGSGWCDEGKLYGANADEVHRKRPSITNDRGVHGGAVAEMAALWQQMPDLAGSRRAAGRGVHSSGLDLTEKLPNLSGYHSPLGDGIHAKRPQLTGNGPKGVQGRGRQANLRVWFAMLQDRLRRVRVTCGDWSRVCTPAVTTGIGLTGAFLDPPYSAEADRDGEIYAIEDLAVAHAAREWCLERGRDPLMRIALCGYEGEHEELEAAGWAVHTWKTGGGYGNQNQGGKAHANRLRERIWFSPHCPTGQNSLF